MTQDAPPGGQRHLEDATGDVDNGTREGTGDRRLFIAVPLPVAAARSVAALVDDIRAAEEEAGKAPLRRGSTDVRWVRLDALHVTIRFLGPTPEEQVPALAAVVAQVAAVTRPFVVEIAGSGAFPDPRRPRVLWLGLANGITGLGRLAAVTNEALAPLGWASEDRPFRAHLTLARSDGVRAGPRLAQRLIAASAGLSIPWRAERLVLFESVTGGGPARYIPLSEAIFPTN